jgi:hypothetical protein
MCVHEYIHAHEYAHERMYIHAHERRPHRREAGIYRWMDGWMDRYV